MFKKILGVGMILLLVGCSNSINDVVYEPPTETRREPVNNDLLNPPFIRPKEEDLVPKAPPVTKAPIVISGYDSGDVRKMIEGILKSYSSDCRYYYSVGTVRGSNEQGQYWVSKSMFEGVKDSCRYGMENAIQDRLDDLDLDFRIK